MSDQSNIIGYGILVRHPGFVDRMLPHEQNTYYPLDNIDHWVSASDRESMIFASEGAAETLADELRAKFGGKGYRFTVAVRRLTPRWFILTPVRESERRPIGSCEQIL